MSLKQKFQSDLTEAMKNKEELKSSVLRMLLTAISNKETEKRTKIWKAKPESSVKELEKESQLTDEETIDVVVSEAKKRREAILEYEKREDLPSHLLEKVQGLADKEKKEAAMLQKYLPEQLSEEEVKKLVKEAITKVGAKEPKDMGRVMAELMPQVRGKADMSLVSKIVKESLLPKA